MDKSARGAQNRELSRLGAEPNSRESGSFRSAHFDQRQGFWLVAARFFCLPVRDQFTMTIRKHR